MMTRSTTGEARAAGTVLLRETARGPELLLVHRSGSGDWALPEGRLRPDETAPVAAVRETLEQTGYAVRLGAPAGTASHDVGGRRKQVAFWQARAVGAPVRRIGSEIDDTRWLGIDDAMAALSHDSARTVATAAVRLPPTGPIVVARHAKARSRRGWPGADADRPLTKRGNDQILRLAGLLAAWSPARVISSPSVRCTASIQPYAARTATTVELAAALSEEGHRQHPDGLVQLLAEVRAVASSPAPTASGAPATGFVLCTHRPVLPAIADALGIPLDPGDREEALPTAGCWVLHVSDTGTEALERHAV